MPVMDAACDYVIVGSGAGGGTLAARLAEAGKRVVLLEAGRDPLGESGRRLPEDYEVPAFHPFAAENPAMSWDFFVRHYEDETQQRRDPKCTPRGIVLSARRNARRLHRAQRHDPGLAAGRRLERHRHAHGRFVMARCRDAALLAAA